MNNWVTLDELITDKYKTRTKFIEAYNVWENDEISIDAFNKQMQRKTAIDKCLEYLKFIEHDCNIENLTEKTVINNTFKRYGSKIYNERIEISFKKEFDKVMFEHLKNSKLIIRKEINFDEERIKGFLEKISGLFPLKIEGQNQKLIDELKTSWSWGFLVFLLPVVNMELIVFKITFKKVSIKIKRLNEEPVSIELQITALGEPISKRIKRILDIFKDHSLLDKSNQCAQIVTKSDHI